MLKRLFALLILMAVVAAPAAAEQRIIVRTDNGGWLGAVTGRRPAVAVARSGRTSVCALFGSTFRAGTSRRS